MRDDLFRIPPDLTVGPAADALPLADAVNWGMAAFAVDRLRLAADGGRGVKVAVLDTGIDRGHPLLANCVASRNFVPGQAGADDPNGHGSHCGGTVAATDPRIGVATNATLLDGRCLSAGGSGAGTWIAAALRWAAGQGAEVVSMSLGSATEDPTITAAMAELAAAGIWIFAAAGNSGAGTPDVDWPGRSPHCVSVAALNADLTPASFSNSGAKIDTAGPGVAIWSARPGGGFRQMSGTSMATPFAAGLGTLLRAALKAAGRPVPHVAGLRALLATRSTDVGPPGADRRSGPGWMTPLLLAGLLTPDPPAVGG